MTRTLNYFKEKEYACKCGCGKASMDRTFMFMVNQARDFARVPFVVNSGCRCEEHNRNVGGSLISSHLIGRAFDIKAEHSDIRFVIIRSLLLVGFSRIGVGEDFIHVDNDPSKPRKVFWLY